LKISGGGSGKSARTVDSYPRLRIALAGLAGITAVGTLGYMLVEGLSWDEALYMTVITISTVGYGEVVPLSRVGRLFTLGLIVTGVGLGFYLLTVVAEQVVRGGLRDLMQRTAMQRRIDRLANHVILCGYGRFGEVVAEELAQAGEQVVVVESDTSKEPQLTKAGLSYVIGTAVSDEVLTLAGIERARSIVIATSSDSDNVFITLAARERNPKLRIHTRGESPEVQRRLIRAGAHQVISAYQMGGARMAASILRPSVVDFFDLADGRWGREINLEEIAVDQGSALDGQRIGEIEAGISRLHVVALKRGTEVPRLVPDPAARVGRDDHLMVIGERAGLEKLAQLAQRSTGDDEET
jgi:voltage-gated potassium channel